MSPTGCASKNRRPAMPDDERMFAQLMEEGASRDPAEKPAPQAKLVPKRDNTLPRDLEDIGSAGYTSHSYRLTEVELRWLRRFSLQLSERLDRTVSHNTLIRLLLRLGDAEWSSNPNKNRLLDLLSRLKG
jgi:hypothetical protein